MSVKQGIHITLFIGNLLLNLLFFIPMEEPAAFLQFIGHLHPMVLHFPLVLLLVALLFEFYSLKKPTWAEPADFLLGAGAATAYVSALAGFLLSVSGSYSGQTFESHKWLGLGISWLATALYAGKGYLQARKLYLPVFVVASILLIITGHLGANLTHGEGFLTKVFEEKAKGIPDPTTALFDAAIQPILEDKCTSCHNANKQEGGLLLTSAEMLRKGGESGQVLLAGDLKGSKLISYLHLPLNDDLHMPPKGKMQLSREEIELLDWWVSSGASFENSLGELAADEPIQATLASYFGPDEAAIAFASESTIEKLKSEGININPISEDSPYLAAYMGNRKELGLAELKQLRKISEQLYSLDLGSSPVTNRLLKELGRHKNLHRLYLDNTDIGDAQLSQLKKLKKLEYLNLYGTAVTQKGVSRLIDKLPSLKNLYLWQTEISEEEMADLQQEFSSIDINGGLKSDSFFASAQLVPPTIDFESVFFNESMTIEADYRLANAQVYYQLDDGPFEVLQGGSLTIDHSAKVSFMARKEGWEDSEIRTETFVKINQPALARQALKYDPKGSYTGKGVATIFDLRKGSENFRDGEWLGFNGDDLVVNVTLDQKQELSSVYVSTLDDINSWIFPPTKLEVWAGETPDQMRKLSELSIKAPEGPEPKHMLIHQLRFEKQAIKHLLVKAVNYGDLPEWHQGKGTPAWLFVDEIAFQ